LSLSLSPMPAASLPSGVRSRHIEHVNGLRMHVLEAGHGDPARPLVLLLHGFPELAYTWRKAIVPLAQAGYHVVAPDQRGYGLTTGWDPDYDGELRQFRMLNLVTDVVALVQALGRREVASVVGHDFGSPVAACCALLRPDMFRSVVLMSAPFAGPPALPFGVDGVVPPPAPVEDIHAALAALDPPRRHYQWYYSTRSADSDMRRAPQGLHAFLRAYFHYKSADWPGNLPHPLQGWRADQLALLPTYYVMALDEDMAATVAPFMPGDEAVAACEWLPDAELAVYAEAFGRTGFQGGLQWYRCETEGINAADLRAFSGRTIDVPSMFIAGARDWGIHQKPGSLEAMAQRACTRMQGVHLLEGAGHWVQQERPDAVNGLLREFLARQG
jgi:pimeloyl-ACP methyl ester carboxylesterase